MFLCEKTEENDVQVFELKEIPSAVTNFRQKELKGVRTACVKKVITNNSEKYNMVIGDEYINDKGDFFGVEKRYFAQPQFCLMQDMYDASFTSDTKTEDDIIKKYYKNGFDGPQCGLLTIEDKKFVNKHYLVDSDSCYKYHSVDLNGRPKGAQIYVVNGIIELPGTLYLLEKLRRGAYLHKEFAPNKLEEQLALFELSNEPVKVFHESELSKLRDFVFWGTGCTLGIDFDRQHKLLQLKRNQMAKK